MREDLEQLKQRIPLLDYLQQRNWTAHRVSAREEFVGLCPLHPETRPSFYVNARKNLFYCHGCERGGDLIRFVELAEHLSFRETVAYLQQDLAVAAESQLLDKTAAFYQAQLHRHPEAAEYLQQRGLCDPELIEELGLGYAPGGNLRRHLTDLGYSLDLLLRTGLISNQGRDAFCRRVIFPCRQHGRVINLYGRSIGAAFPHRLLPRSKGGLFAWESVRTFSQVLLVEGLFDLAVLSWSVLALPRLSFPRSGDRHPGRYFPFGPPCRDSRNRSDCGSCTAFHRREIERPRMAIGGLLGK